MRWVRVTAMIMRVRAMIIVVLAVTGLGIWAGVSNVRGQPDPRVSVALGIAFGVFSVVFTRPALRPPKMPVITVTNPDAAPEEVFGRDEAGFTYVRDGRGLRYRVVGRFGYLPIPPDPPPPPGGTGRPGGSRSWCGWSARCWPGTRRGSCPSN